jgi:hypothetical protein
MYNLALSFEREGKNMTTCMNGHYFKPFSSLGTVGSEKSLNQYQVF